MRSTAIALLLLQTATISHAAAIQPAPVFPAGTTTDKIQGVAVKDPYRALENATTPR